MRGTQLLLVGVFPCTVEPEVQETRGREIFVSLLEVPSQLACIRREAPLPPAQKLPTLAR